MNKIVSALAVTILFIYGSSLAAPKIVFTEGKAGTNETKCIVSSSTGERTECSKLGGAFTTISRSGNDVVYSFKGASADPNKDEWNIVFKNLSSKQSYQLSDSSVNMDVMANFSGDGKYLAVSISNYVEKAKIRIVDVQWALNQAKEGIYPLSIPSTPENAAQIVDIKADADLYFPALFSKGTHVVYMKKPSANQSYIAVTNLVDKTEVILDSEGNNNSPQISFDDKYVVYVKKDTWDHVSTGNVWVYDIANQKAVNLTQTEGVKYHTPSFMADGRILFAKSIDGTYVLVTTENPFTSKNQSINPLFTERNSISHYMARASGDFSIQREVRTPMPGPARSSFGNVISQYNGIKKLYIAGGHQGQGHYYPESSFLKTMYSYDIENDTWTEEGSYVGPGRQSPVLISYGKYIYSFGGFAFSNTHPRPAGRDGKVPTEPCKADEPCSYQSLDIVERYDTVEKKWEIIHQSEAPSTAVSRRRSSHVAELIGNRVYLLGGWDSTPTDKGVIDQGYVKKVDVFNLDTNQFEQNNFTFNDQMSTRRAFTSVVRNGKIIMMGGITGGFGPSMKFLDDVTEFDPQTGNFRELSKLVEATFTPSAVVVRNSIYLLGGMQMVPGSRDQTYVTDIYKLGEKSWYHTGNHLNQRTGFFAANVLNSGEILMFGGQVFIDPNAKISDYIDGKEGKSMVVNDIPTNGVEKMTFNF